MSREVRVTSTKPCPKCGNKVFNMAEVVMQGGGVVRWLSFPTKRFTTFSCDQCTYTEFFKVPMKRAPSVLDMFET